MSDTPPGVGGAPRKMALEVRLVRKRFGALEAVRGVSFSVAPGEVLGLLGPNGAGKTTLIRMALDILRPDAGDVLVGGAPLTRAARDRIGYLPEERGVYQRATALEVVSYAARLKGLGWFEARRKAAVAIERVGLGEVAKKMVRDLSKGMQQKIQLAATVVHAPDVLVLDEPLSGLDPINRRLVREVIREEAARGAAVVLSSHEMEIVEHLCEKAILVNRGEALLSGGVHEIRQRFAKNDVRLQLHDEKPLEAFPDALALVAERLSGHRASEPVERLRLKAGATPEAFLGALLAGGATFEVFERALPSLDDVFVEAVEAREAALRQDSAA